MRRARRAEGSVVLVVAAALAAPAEARGADHAHCDAVVSERFALFSDPLINLHHFLYQWARAASPPDGERWRDVEVRERLGFDGLPPEQREVWNRATDHYRAHLVPRDLLFDGDLVALKHSLVDASCSEDGVAGLEGERSAVLAAALPVYREHWWPAHDAANRTWIESQAERLAGHEAGLARRLAEAYGGPWPADPIRVDVTAYANWAGAYTTNAPDHVTITGASHPGLQGLELLLHEVSHAAGFEQPLLGQVAAAFRKRGLDPPARLAHVIQFVTPAELVRHLAGEGADAVLIADEMARRPRNRDRYRVVRAHWRPFLEGELSRAEALDRIVGELTP